MLKSTLSALIIALASTGTLEAQLQSVRQTIYGMD